MKSYYRKVHFGKGAVFAIIGCAAAIVILIVAIVYAGGFVNTDPEKPARTIAQKAAESGTANNNEAIEISRDGKILKDIKDMSLEEIWVNDPREKTEVKGIYISDKTIGNSDLFSNLIELCDSTELNAMVINVKNDYGEVTTDLNIPLAAESNAVSVYIENMQTLIDRLHEHNIYAVARICTFKDTVLAKAKPEYACKNNDGSVYTDGNGYSWINPYNRDSWTYFTDIAKACINIGFDEIQFDQLRVPTGIGYNNIDYGSESANISKSDIIAEFMEFAYKELINSGAYISATVNGACILHKSDGELIGQDYAKLSRWVDYICPMCYPSDYNPGEYDIENPDASPYDFVNKLMEDSKHQLAATAASGHVADVRPWLQGYSADWLTNYTVYGSDQYKAQIKAVQDNGYTQWAFWCSSGEYATEAF